MGVWAAGHGVEPKAIRQGHYVSRMAMIIDDRGAEVLSSDMEGVRKLFAVLEEELGLQLITRRDPRIEPRFPKAFAMNEAGCSGPGPSNLAGFLGDLETRTIEEPFGLEGHEELVLWWDDLGFHGWVQPQFRRSDWAGV